MARSSTLTKRYYEEAGHLIGFVEQKNPRTREKKDLFGFADQVAIDDQPGVCFVQSTIGRHAEHRRKILASSEAQRCLAAGNRIALISWAKKRNPETGHLKWTPRIEAITLKMF